MTEALRSLAWLEPAVDIARLACFVAFVVLGLRAAAAGRAGVAEGRVRVDRFLAFVLGVSAAVGFVQQESWPFSQWALVHNLASKRVRSWEMEAFDGAGRAYPVDPRVLQPLAPEEFGAWLLAHLPQLALEGKRSVGLFILRNAEEARLRLVRGEAVARNEWLLGPLAAPYHFHERTGWTSRADVPETPFVGLRIWLLEWEVEERLHDEGRIDKRLLLEVDGAPAT